MKYDTTIRTVTRSSRVTTQHADYIDWDYNFNDPKHTECMCANGKVKQEEIERRIRDLKTCERFAEGNVYASNYGGWPRIWHKVIAVGMVSAWPYWEPRPNVLVDSTFGYEWFDWWHITGAEIREAT